MMLGWLSEFGVKLRWIIKNVNWYLYSFCEFNSSAIEVNSVINIVYCVWNITSFLAIVWLLIILNIKAFYLPCVNAFNLFIKCFLISMLDGSNQEE